jgi:hypothetical protein
MGTVRAKEHDKGVALFFEHIPGKMTAAVDLQQVERGDFGNLIAGDAGAVGLRMHSEDAQKKQETQAILHVVSSFAKNNLNKQYSLILIDLDALFNNKTELFQSFRLRGPWK